MNSKSTNVILLSTLLFISPCFSAELPDYYVELSEHYAEVMINTPNRDERREKLEVLLEEAESIDEEFGSPFSAFVVARIRTSYMILSPLFRIRKQLRLAKEGLELSLERDDRVLDGLPQAYLGYLYLLVPGWPVSFGDTEKGKAYLQEAMSINHTDSAVNYFYSFYFREDENIEGALNQLAVAQSLAEDTDTRLPNLRNLLQREIDDDLKELRKQLEK